MEVASKEDIFSLHIIKEIFARPKCGDYLEDKSLVTFLSMKLAELVSINPNYHLSQGWGPAFFTKLHSEVLIVKMTMEWEEMKDEHVGLLSHIKHIKLLLNKNIKFIDKLISSEKLSKIYTTNDGLALPTPDDRQLSTDYLEVQAIPYDRQPSTNYLEVQARPYQKGNTLRWQSSSQQHRGKRCLVCGQRHYSLIQCPRLTEYIPMGSVKTNKAICYICLGTVAQDGCDHNGHKDYLKTFCEVGGCSALLCRHCTKHKKIHAWFIEHHKAKAGFKNWEYIEQGLTPKVTLARTS